jgi:4-hydroxy-tetrahydrodipicolinate synthase
VYATRTLSGPQSPRPRAFRRGSEAAGIRHNHGRANRRAALLPRPGQLIIVALNIINQGSPMFRGSYTALITPFRDNRVDEEAFRALVDRQIEAGTHGLVPVGTTGESPTLSHDEHKAVIEMCIAQAAGRVPVIAGAGSNNTAEAVEFSAHAAKAGADGVLSVTPYYNKPTQDGLYQHFKAINDAVDIPIIIYNIPGRSVVDMSVETMARLYELPNIAGVKDATANMARVSQQRAAMGESFIQLSGEDATALGFNAHGGHGCISVTANVAPALCARFQNACEARDYTTALKLHDRLMPLHEALFIESNPAPVKYAAQLLGFCREDIRAPLATLRPESKQAVARALEQAGVS